MSPRFHIDIRHNTVKRCRENVIGKRIFGRIEIGFCKRELIRISAIETDLLMMYGFSFQSQRSIKGGAHTVTFADCLFKIPLSQI